MTAIAGGIALIVSGKDVQGLASIVTAFTALATVFVYGRWQRQREREQKRKEAREASENPRLPFDAN
jgi:hypothetical protein